jgi:hypothetical protein
MWPEWAPGRSTAPQVGTASLTDYLDLGANVILLWYGGTMVLHHEGAMTAGKYSPLTAVGSHGRSIASERVAKIRGTLR